MSYTVPLNVDNYISLALSVTYGTVVDELTLVAHGNFNLCFRVLYASKLEVYSLRVSVKSA